MRDDELLQRFERGELDGFPHLDHVRVVYLQARRAGEASALAFARTGLRALTRAAGVPDKYHETITTAWVRLVSGRALAEPAQGFDAFLDRNPALRRVDLLADYYSPGRLASPEARVCFVEPDLKPLP